MTKLKRIKISGFKSIKEMDLEMRDLNVLIGANGVGKSNLVSFFRLLGALAQDPARGPTTAAAAGTPSFLLHYGPKTTQTIAARLEFAGDPSIRSYSLQSVFGTDGALHWLHNTSTEEDPRFESAYGWHPAFDVMKRWETFQFHDTSDTASVRLDHYLNDSHQLLPDAGNLAAYLYVLRETKHEYYQRIFGTIRLIAPFFDDFVLAPSPLNPEMIRLDWRERDRDMVFGPHQLSDGTLRAMALITLLLQPEDALPPLLIIDEPELGLHPYALSIVAGLIRAASSYVQVIVSTQSERLVDEFEPEDMVVVERVGGESRFTRLDPTRLSEWLEEYTLGELWEKNVIGGRPAW